ncbi:glycosyltransferase family 4 protein [Marinobacter sp.]|uniref:glycosyltransferase family 4 protein n=1 Tax=Marinobacter sp. TaxID=50741 RepID=UPI003A8F89EB
MKQDNNGNILLVSNYPSDVGYAWWLMEHFWVLLADHFRARGGKAFLAYPSITALPDTIKDSCITPVELEVPNSGALPSGVTAFIKTNNIQHIYLTDRPWFDPRYAALRQAGLKNIVVHDHTPGDRPPVGGIKGLVKAIRHRLPLICADSQLCVSPLMRQRSISNGRIPRKRCHVVQNGIPPVQPAMTSREFLLKSLDIPSNRRVCITTGRAHPYKRFDFIINTAAELQKTDPDNNLVFVLIGDGPDLSRLQRQVEELNLQEQVRLPGFRADAKDFLSAADMAMHAALGEGFSLSIVEYMSAGLPVLVPDIPSVKQAIDHGDNGFVYEQNNVANAASYITALLNDESRREKMGQSAKKKANSHYSLDNCTREFRRVCQTLF